MSDSEKDANCGSPLGNEDEKPLSSSEPSAKEKREKRERGEEKEKKEKRERDEDEDGSNLKSSGDVKKTLRVKVTSTNVLDFKDQFLKHIRKGEQQKVKLLLHKGMPWNVCTKDGMPAIHLAAQHNHISCISLLLHWKADLSLVEPETKGTPLHVAAREGHSAAVKYLLSKKAEVDARDKFSRTPLMLSCSIGAKKIVNLLLAEGADVAARDAVQSTPAHYAAYGGHLSVIDVLIAAGADVQASDRNGLTPFLHACAQGHLSTAQRLLNDVGVDLETVGVQGGSALHFAAYNSHYEVVKAIIEKAKQDGGDDFVKRLLQIRDDEGALPLHKAAYSGIGPIVELLLVNGAEINVIDREGATPLHKAAFSAKVDTVSVLLAHGAAIDMLDRCGGTALFNACYSGSSACIVEFLKHPDISAVINISDAEGRTPAKAAALNGHNACVDLVMAATVRLGIMTPARVTHISTV